MSAARVAPLPGAGLEAWRASRAAAGSPLPEASDGGRLEAVTLTVDEVEVGGALLEYDADAGRQRCSVRVLQTTLPAEAAGAWAAAIAALETHVLAQGVDLLSTAVPPALAGVFGRAGYRATMTTLGKRLDPTALGFQEDRRVAVRPMDAAERAQFVVEVGEMLRAGMARAGVADPTSAGLDVLDAQLSRLEADPPPPLELLMIGTVDGVPVGRAWATVVEVDGVLDLHGNTIELFPEHRGRRLTPSFLGALRRHVHEVGVRDVHLNIYGHDADARRTLMGAGVGIEDVHLRKDLR